MCEEKTEDEVYKIKLNRKLGVIVYIRIVKIMVLLNECSRVLLEKLTGFQLVKNFPAFYGTRRFITAITSVIIILD